MTTKYGQLTASRSNPLLKAHRSPLSKAFWLPSQIYRWYLDEAKIRQAIRDLEVLDDHSLKDIGLQRGAIESQVRTRHGGQKQGMLVRRKSVMWPDHRLIDLFRIEHPLLLAPMAGISTVELAAAVCDAGGLGSIGCAMMQPEIAGKTIRELRGSTSQPINVNFSCHVQAKQNADREHAWHDRLLPYYRELEIDDEPRPRIDIAPFGDAMCAVVEDARPEVVSFHFGLPDPVLPFA